MSDESLTTEEVDTLLEGVSTEDADRAAAVGRSRASSGETTGPLVRPYDLKGAAPNPQRLPVLEAINQRIGRSLRTALERLLDRPVEVAVGPVEQIAYQDFIAALEQPTNLNVLDAGSLHGQALLVCEPALLLGMTDLLFGGSGRSSAGLDGRRDFSATELRIIHRVVGLFVDACAAGWEPVHALSLIHRRCETLARFAAIAQPRAMVFSMVFEVRAGEAVGRMVLCLPAAAIEPVRKALAAAEDDAVRAHSPRWQDHMARRIQSAEVTVSAEFAHASATVADLLRLRPGDFIELDLKPTATARVDEIPFFECRYGVSNKRYAIRIQSFLAARNEADCGEQHDRQ
jgi:flagellar motor switch protein FliM